MHRAVRHVARAGERAEHSSVVEPNGDAQVRAHGHEARERKLAGRRYFADAINLSMSSAFLGEPDDNNFAPVAVIATLSSMRTPMPS